MRPGSIREWAGLYGIASRQFLVLIPLAVLIAVARVVEVGFAVSSVSGRQDLVGVVVAVLGRVEKPPSSPEGNRILRAQQPAGAGVSIRKMPTGNLVIPVILEPGHSRKGGIDRGGRISSLRQDADWLRAAGS